MIRDFIVASQTALLLLSAMNYAEAQIIIENPLQAVKVISLETSPRMINLTVRNETPQNITAIEFASFAPSADTLMSIDSILGGEEALMVPAVDKTFKIDRMPEHPTSKIRIVLVVFADGSGEGNSARIEFMKNARMAQRDQMRRIAPFWSSLSDKAETGDEAALDWLLKSTLAEVSALPEIPELELSDRNFAAQQIGLRRGKTETIFAIRELQKTQQHIPIGSSKEAMVHFMRLHKEQFDQILAKLEKEAM